MLKYIKELTPLLSLDVKQYKKKLTKQDWLQRLIKNNSIIKQEIQRFQRSQHPEIESIDLTSKTQSTSIQPSAEEESQQAYIYKNQKSKKSAIIKNVCKSNEQPLPRSILPSIHINKQTNCKKNDTIKKSMDKIIQRKFRQKAVVHFVDISQSVPMFESLEAKSSKSKISMDFLRFSQLAKFKKRFQSEAKKQLQTIFNDTQIANNKIQAQDAKCINQRFLTHQQRMLRQPYHLSGGFNYRARKFSSKLECPQTSISFGLEKLFIVK